MNIECEIYNYQPLEDNKRTSCDFEMQLQKNRKHGTSIIKEKMKVKLSRNKNNLFIKNFFNRVKTPTIR